MFKAGGGGSWTLDDVQSLSAKKMLPLKVAENTKSE